MQPGAGMQNGSVQQHPFALAVRNERIPVPSARDPKGSPPAVIRGELRRPEGVEPDTAVVVAHGFKGFRRWGFFPHLARTLAQDGHAVVTFDFSLNGVGAGGEDFDDLAAFARNTFSREVAELSQVVEALRGGVLPGPVPERVAILGHSRGGGVAVLAAEALRTDALVTWAAVATFDRWGDEVKEEWREKGRIHIANARTGQNMPLDLTLLEDLEANREALDLEGAAGRIQAPWLIVHGSDDEAVSIQDAHRLHRASGERATLEIIEGAGHTFGAAHPFSGEPPHLAQALAVTREHLQAALGAEG
jgi:uncharacterized protein